MKRIVIMLAGLAMVAGIAFTATAADFSYVGVKKCKMCHKRPAAGEQFKIWSESPHAKAFTSLASEKAMEIAKEKGIDKPQEAPECLKCHVTGYGQGDIAAAIVPENGVGCESCHGPGSAYKKKTTMKGLYAGEIDPASVGMNVVTEKTCKTCHNEESPNYNEFNFKERVKEIAHPVPKKE